MTKLRQRRMLIGRVSGLVAVLALVGIAGGAARANAGGDLGEAEKARFFDEQVRPVLETTCFKCHGAEEKIRGGLRLTSRAAILTGGDMGPAVSLQRPGESLLLKAIGYADDELRMPPKQKLPAEQIAALTRWVEMGLPWPGGDDEAPVAAAHRSGLEVTEEASKFWAYQPVRRPAVPRVNDRSWIRTPIDAFVLAKLESKGLAPAPPAEKAALLRRAYYDLVGLPPTPQEVDAFLADESADAFEKVIERLLSMPQYGEKWGRHWLDLVRYAETNGYERDGPKPHVWRYRDYIIDSFNRDKPYDRFMIEQLAGDELEDASAEMLIATGYYRLGLWDDEPVDKLQAYYDSLDDVVSTTGQVFLAMTIGCARCHDHKIDPVPQKDYYRFLAFFRNTRLGDGRAFDYLTTAPIAPEHEIAAHRQKEKELAEQIKTLEETIRGCEERIYATFSGPERDDARDERTRRLLIRQKRESVLSAEELKAYLAAMGELQTLRRSKLPPLAEALVIKENGSDPSPTHVLIRGSAHAKGEEVEPGLPSILGAADVRIASPLSGAPSSGRRLALARWLATEPGRYAARVMANRIWQFHFDRGIVDSPSDFGHAGTLPTHPELLDFLASEFVDRGWSIKAMHRLIMTSSAYRMSARDDERGVALDPANGLLRRFNMRRLTAEEVRDSILHVNGTINLKMGGPSIFTPVPAAVLHTASRPDAAWGRSPPQEQVRRSVYVHVKRSLHEPVLASLDMADTDASCPVRFVTTVPTQTLTSLNSDFYHEQAKLFAKRLRTEAGDDPKRQVELAFRLALCRPAKPDEVRRSLDLMRSWQEEDGVGREQALDYFCLMVLNLNEFVYLD